MKQRDYVYGNCLANELEQLNDLQSQSLNLPLDVTKKWSQIFELECHRTVQCQKELVGGLAYISDEQHFGGRPVSCACVSAVAVAPHFRGYGVGKYLMNSFVQELAESDLAISSLYPSSWTFYRNAGYELAGSRNIFKAPISALPKGKKEHDVVPASVEEVSSLSSMWRKTYNFENGTLARIHPFFQGEKYLAKDELQVYKAMKEDTCEGYLTFCLRKEKQTITIDTICAVNDLAMSSLLGFLRRYDPIYPEIAWCGEPLDGMAWFFSERHYKLVHHLPWMTRILQVDKALTQRGYPKSFKGEFHFHVSDSLVAQNDGPWKIVIEDGRAHVERGGEGNIKLDVTSLVPLYTGSLSPRSLAFKQRLQATPEQLEALCEIFAGKSPYLSQMF